MARADLQTADDLRKAFVGFFSDRAHTVVPSASLIPFDPSIMFTVAGMVPFKPYFVGEETAPFDRAVSVQKCVRAGGKHNDLDDVGRTKRHLVFFEMLGNFSFGDYFKEKAIPWGWELATEVFGFDGDRLWITVHESDDEAEQIWHDVVGVPMERIQRLGDKDNFWQMGDVGPCGPCSEIHIDRGSAFGPDGGPLHDPAGDRFLEFWNLVFMQYNQAKDGSRTRLPRPSIDTGAGFERILTLVQGVDSVWETDLLAPLIDVGRRVTGAEYRIGDYEHRPSFSLRVLAEHARSSMMMINDGVFPSNEGRGYVLRRIIRRAVRHAYLLGCEKLVMPSLVETSLGIMKGAYPELATNSDFILGVITREEEKFRSTLRTGLSILEGEFSGKAKSISGSSAFALHDTYGFPLELTQEIASERGVSVDTDGFESEMTQQRERAKSARKNEAADPQRVAAYKSLVDVNGATNFVGYDRDATDATVLAVLGPFDHEDGSAVYEMFLDSSPFYAESGGQVGDTGTIVSTASTSGQPTASAQVIDTTFAAPGLRRHLVRITRGSFATGDRVHAAIDSIARAATRRNHTATHVLHWALREVLGEHVKQAGSLVAPDRLRFDFSHYEAVTAAEIRRIEQLSNAQVIANSRVTAEEMSKQAATEKGAIAFFGDKYGDVVRVLEAGSSLELCGGTHVAATGDIGPIKVISEGSIGSNLRRIEAVTGDNAVHYLLDLADRVANAADVLGTKPDDIVSAAQRAIDNAKALTDEVKKLRAANVLSQAGELAEKAIDGALIMRVDGISPAELRDLAIAVRTRSGIEAVVLGGVSDSGGVALVAAVTPASGLKAGDLIKDAAKQVGGGGGGKGDIATAGGKNAAALDDALATATKAVDAARRGK
ncbi:alanine--tRNA ligase [Actinomycetes bacterium]|nr:alanine--tRNA ligase [Actinomycetes bacterium]